MKNTSIPKKTIVVEFGSDEFLDNFHAVLNMITQERETMENRHKRIIEMFMQDVKIYKNEEKYDK